MPGRTPSDAMSFALGETSTGAASGDAGELAISGDGATIPGHLLEEPAAKGGRRGRGSPAKIGRFVILRTLGEGGMGVVYSAYDDELDRKLAIKVVRSALAGRDVSRARIRREAQAMAKLSHPNVVQIYEVGEWRGEVFVAMEFVTGETLERWAKEALADPERGWRGVLAKYVDAARGLAAAHAAGLVHRDFKPDNVIVGEDGRARVLDFGIARSSADDDGAARPGVDAGASAAEDTVLAGQLGASALETPLTATGALMGTPAYMSPEQFVSKRVDARSDQFSLCVSLYEGLYGERPFTGETVGAIMVSVLEGEVRPAPADARVPEWLRRVLLRGLEVDPGARWPSLDALIEALQADPARRRHARLRAAGVLAALVLTIAGAGWFARAQRQAAREAAAQEAVARQQKREADELKQIAERERDGALARAKAGARRARDIARVLLADALRLRDPTTAYELLAEVEAPAQARGYAEVAINVLQRPPSAAVLRGHEDEALYVDFSPDGRWLVSASNDGTARVWPTDGRGPELTLRGHDDKVYTAEFSPDGARVITASRDGTARVWEVGEALAGGALRALELRGHDDIVWSATFSPAGERALTVSRDGTGRVWSLPAAGERVPPPRVLVGHENIVWGGEFSPDGRWAVTAAADGTARVWRLDEGEPGRSPPATVLSGHTNRVWEARFDPSGRRVVTVSDDGTARVFVLDEDGALKGRPRVFRGHTRPVRRVALSPDGRYALTSSRDGTARVWALDDPSAPSRAFRTRYGTTEHAVFGPAGRRVIAGGGDRVARVWSVEDERAPLELPGHVDLITRVAVDRRGELVASASRDGSVRVWRISHIAARARLAHAGRPVMTLSDDGRVLATGDSSGRVRAWDVASLRADGLRTSALRGQLDARCPVSALAVEPAGRWLVVGCLSGAVLMAELPDHVTEVGEPRASATRTLTSFKGSVGGLEFSADGRRLLATSLDSTARVWALDPTDGATRGLASFGHSEKLETVGIYDAALSRDGLHVATGGRDSQLGLWTLAPRDAAPRGTPPIELRVREITDHRNGVFAVAIDPRGRWLASTGGDRRVLVRRVEDGEIVREMSEHTGQVGRLTFSSAGDRLLTASHDGTARVFRSDADDEPRVLRGHHGVVREAVFSPDDRVIATSGSDTELRLWPAGGGDSLALRGHDEEVFQILFTPDGELLITRAADETIRLWSLDAGLEVEGLQARLAEAISSCLSIAQRERLVGQDRETAARRYAECERRNGRARAE